MGAKKGSVKSEETKRKMSEARSRWWTSERRASMGLAQTGDSNVSKLPEQRDRMRVARTGNNNPLYGTHHSSELRLRISEAVKKTKREQRGGGPPIKRYHTLLAQARRRGLSVLLTLEEHALLLEKPCHYCNHPLNSSGCGVDRKDSMQAYTPDNVVPCCWPCNQIKGILTYREMLIIMAYRRKHHLPPFTN